MFKNYIKTAVRNMQRNKSYTLVNIIGLGMGMASAILIFILVSYHLSFDNFHPNKDRIYRVVTELHQEQISNTPGVPPPFAKAFRNDFTYAEKVCRVITFSPTLISFNSKGTTKKFQEENGVAFTKSEYFDIFNFPILAGYNKNVLNEPNTALITENLAKKYFPGEQAIGKLIQVDNNVHFKIIAILKNLPENTDRKSEIYLSDENIKEYNPFFSNDKNWRGINSATHCFIRLKSKINPSQVESGLKLLGKKYYGNNPNFPKANNMYHFLLQPLSNIHFNTQLDGYVDKKYIWALILIGAFLLISACVNFINLSTALALKRSKEIGIRKTIGSLKSQIYQQFMVETFIITLFGMFLSLLLVKITLPLINGMLKTNLSMNLLSNPLLVLFILLLVSLVVFLSGSYPGLVLSNFLPISTLKGKINQKNVGGISLRRILVVTQFSISQILILSIIVIASQINYSKNSDLGFNKSSIIMLPIPMNDSLVKIRMETFKNKISGLLGVEKISFCYEAPASDNNNTDNVRFDNRNKDELFHINTKTADNRYLETFNLTLIKGRNFYPGDTLHEVLVNETLVKKLNLPSINNVIGKYLSIGGSKKLIVGVVKDFYNNSFRGGKDAIAIFPGSSDYTNCAIKINLNRTQTILGSLEKIWNQIYPEYFYKLEFLDERIARFYLLDNILLKLIEAFAIVAILIGCMGLYGLVSFFAENKTKEIGIRKVLGAGFFGILWIFGKEFLRMVLISFFIASPIAWFAIYKYLEDFTYRIPVNMGLFLLTLTITLVLVSLTVGFRTLKAILANPIKSLRTE